MKMGKTRETDGIFEILTSKSSIFAVITFSLKSVECPKMMVEKKIPRKTITFPSTPLTASDSRKGGRRILYYGPSQFSLKDESGKPYRDDES